MNSKSLFLIIIIQLISKIYSLTKLEIYYSKENNKYSLLVNLGSQKISIALSLDTSIPLSLINSPKCIVCTNSRTYTYEPTQSKDSQFIKESSYTKGKYEYKGIAYSDSISISTYESQEKVIKNQINLLSINEISLVTKIAENGYLSLSYYSDILNQMEKRIFVFECSDSSGTITLGGINTDVINTTQLVYFPIKTDEEIKKWYLESNFIEVFNSTTKNKIEKPQRIVIDSTTWQVHVPKSFFYQNAKLILSSFCQVQPTGQFYCDCKEKESYDFFPTFQFDFGNGRLLVEPKDYLAFEPSSNYCILYMNINYATDDWILGINVLNNYYTVFDYENKQIAFYDRKNGKTDSSRFLIILISVGLSSVLILFGGFWIYKKCLAHYFNQPSIVVDENGLNHDSQNNVVN